MPTKPNKKPKRVILKLSGESLMGNKDYGIDSAFVEKISREVKSLLKDKIQLGIVVGGGNFFRGGRLQGLDVSRVTGDHLGMIATILNAITVQDIFLQLKIPTKVVSALPIEGIVERYDYRRVNDYLNQGEVVILAGGIGNPFVTTDTTLCLRGIELNADLLLKATNVDGVYSADPKKNPKAKLYSHLTYSEALSKKLAVMDLTAFCLGRDHNMRLKVFNIHKKGAILRAVKGLKEGTLVEN